MTAEHTPQAGDLYAYMEDGRVVFVPPARQLTTWRGANPFKDQCRKPLGKGEKAAQRIFNAKARSKAT